jgi:hypothetical protein
VPAPPPARSADDLAWIATLLWDPARTLLGADGLPGPAGYRRVERYVVTPRRADPRVLVPLAARPAAATLDSYARLRALPARAARQALGLAARVGLLRALPRASLWVRSDVPASALPTVSLPAHLATALRTPEVLASIALGTPGPNRKPVLQLLRRDGGVVGFVKVGWNDATRAQVDREAQVLAALRDAPPASFSAPRLLASEPWRTTTISVAAPLPEAIRRHRDLDGPPPLAVSREIAARGGTGSAALAESAYWRRLHTRADAADAFGPEAAAAVAGALARLARAYGDDTVAFGSWHGDWVPWNVGWSGTRLHVWDWEHAHGDVPLGFDLVHWHFQVAFVVRGRALADALADARDRSAGALAALGVEPVDLLVALYLIERTLRFAAALAAGAGHQPRFFPAVLDVLAALR